MYKPQIDRLYLDTKGTMILIKEFKKMDLEKTFLKYIMPGSSRQFEVKGFASVSEFLDGLELLLNPNKEQKRLEEENKQYQQQINLNQQAVEFLQDYAQSSPKCTTIPKDLMDFSKYPSEVFPK